MVFEKVPQAVCKKRHEAVSAVSTEHSRFSRISTPHCCRALISRVLRRLILDYFASVSVAFREEYEYVFRGPHPIILEDLLPFLFLKQISSSEIET